MSDVMLHGVLNMPLPNDPKDIGVCAWLQFRDTAREASRRIEALDAQLAQANAALEAADNMWEHTNELLQALEYLGVSGGGIPMLEDACGVYKKARGIDAPRSES